MRVAHTHDIIGSLAAFWFWNILVASSLHYAQQGNSFCLETYHLILPQEPAVLTKNEIVSTIVQKNRFQMCTQFCLTLLFLVCFFVLNCLIFPKVFFSNLDQLWGLLSRRLGRSTQLIDANSARDVIAEELRKPSVVNWIGGNAEVHVLRCYRNWKKHFEEKSPMTFVSWS